MEKRIITINSLRIEAVPLLPYMDRPADTKCGMKHRCTDAAMEYFKSEVMEMCHRENLYQIDLLHGSKNRVTEREYWAQKKGQLALDKANAPMIADGKNEYISNLCRYPLLILDDFGMERGTEYGLEQVYNVIDSRYRSGKPLIVTTNLTLTELQNPQDTPHARIYDRLLEMCAPVCFSGENFRRESAQNKLNRLKQLMND